MGFFETAGTVKIFRFRGGGQLMMFLTVVTHILKPGAIFTIETIVSSFFFSALKIKLK